MWWHLWPDQLVNWAEWDYIFKLIGFIASLVTILGVLSVIVAIVSLFVDRRQRAEERQERRRSLLLALQVNIISLLHTTQADIGFFELTQLDASAKAATWSPEAKLEYQRSYVWAPISGATVEAALREPYLLSLGYKEIVDLASLHVGILHFNAHAIAKNGVAMARDSNPGMMMDRKVDVIDDQIRRLLGDIRSEAEKVKTWCSESLKDAPVPSAGSVPGSS